MKKKILLLFGILCVGVSSFGCTKEDKYKVELTDETDDDVQQVHTAQLGKAMEVDGVVSLTFNKGGIYKDSIYAYYAAEGSSFIEAGEGEDIFGVYGVIENLSSRKFSINDIVDIKVKFNNEYEYSASLCLENEDETDFLTEGNNYFKTRIKEMHPKAKYPCVLICHIGEEVAESSSSKVSITFGIRNNTDGEEEYETFVMQLNMQ